MERKTKVNAAAGEREIVITRDFDLPLDLLFRAYVEADLVEQWMGTKVVKMESKRHGSYEYETPLPKGGTFKMSGAIHDLVLNTKITRTFEMENAGFGVQLELLEFEKINDDMSRLNMRVIYESAAKRDENLKLPFEWGVNMAHNTLQEILSKLNPNQNVKKK